MRKEKGEKGKKRPRSPPSPRGSRRKTGRSSTTPGPSSSVASPAKPGKRSRTEEEDDLTANMEEPPSEPSMTPQPSTLQRPSSKGASYTDLDNPEGGEKEDGGLSEPEDTATDQTHHIVVPSYSAWFDYNAIHAIEKRGLPEFFMARTRARRRRCTSRIGTL